MKSCLLCANSNKHCVCEHCDNFDNYKISKEGKLLLEEMQKEQTLKIFNKLIEIYSDNPIVAERHLQDVFKNEWGVEIDGSEN